MDYLAVGALTHSAPVLDIGLDLTGAVGELMPLMLLAIDIGNTNTVLGVFDGEQIVHSWRVKTDARNTADELMLTFHGLLHGLPVTGIAACSTVPAALRELRTMLARYWPDAADRAGRARHQDRGGAAVRQPEGGRRGPDRQHPGRLPPGQRAGHRRRLRHLDQLRRGQRPRASSSAARWRRASRSRWTRWPPGPPSCARSSWSAPRSPIGKNTVEALQSGILYGFAGQVDGLVRRIAAALVPEAPDAVEVIATGGLAPLVVEHAETVTRHEPDLTLIGLRLIYERNT